MKVPHTTIVSPTDAVLQVAALPRLDISPAADFGAQLVAILAQFAAPTAVMSQVSST